MQFATKVLLGDESEFVLLSRNCCLSLESELVFTDHFFDSPSYFLEEDWDTLRVRIPEGQSTTTEVKTNSFPSLTLKDRNVIQGGDQAAVVYSIEPLPKLLLDKIITSDDVLGLLKTYYDMHLAESTDHVRTIIKRLQSIEDIDVSEKVKCVGSIKTHRKIYKYVNKTDLLAEEDLLNLNFTEKKSIFKDVKFYLDETDFPFGKRYEVEVIVFFVPLVDVHMELVELFNSLSIKYNWSLESKCSSLIKYLKGLDANNKMINAVRMYIENFDGYTAVLNWLKNSCKSVFIPQTPFMTSQALTNAGLNASDTSEYFHATAGETFTVPHDTLNTLSQTQQHWSQRASAGIAEHIISDSFYNDVDKQEYHENYYFDDVFNGTLQMHSCYAELRRINQGSTFIFSLKHAKNMINGSQSSVSNESDLSGDHARHLLENPTDFLNTMREHNNVVAVLWDNYGLRQLNVVAFYRTKRNIFFRPITLISPHWTKLEKNRHRIADDDDLDTEHWTLEGSPESPANTGQTPSISIYLDHTLLDYDAAPTHFSTTAAKTPSCSYATSSEFFSAANSISLYEVEVVGNNENILEDVKNWLVQKIRKQGVELQMANKTKLQKYMNFLAQRQNMLA